MFVLINKSTLHSIRKLIFLSNHIIISTKSPKIWPKTFTHTAPIVIQTIARWPFLVTALIFEMLPTILPRQTWELAIQNHSGSEQKVVLDKVWREGRSFSTTFQLTGSPERRASLRQWESRRVWSWPSFWTTSSSCQADSNGRHSQDSLW